MLCAFFWIIPQRLNFICRRFGTLCLFHLHRQVGVTNDRVGVSGPDPPCHPPSYWLRLYSSQTLSLINTRTFLKPSHSSHLPAYEDVTECSETSAYKIQTPGNYPEESIQWKGCLWTGRSNVRRAGECCWSYVSAHKVSRQFHIHVLKAKETNCLLLSVVRISSRNFTIMRSAIICTVIADYLNIPRKLKCAKLMCHLSTLWLVFVTFI